MLFRYLLIAILIAPVLGCISAEQQQANREAEAARQEQARIEYAASLKRQCDAIGYRPDTDQWRECILRLHQQAQAQNAALRNVLIQQYLMNQPQRPTTTNCTRDYFGNVKCTTR